MPEVMLVVVCPKVNPDRWPAVRPPWVLPEEKQVDQQVVSSVVATILRHRLRRRSGSGCQQPRMVDGSTVVGWWPKGGVFGLSDHFETPSTPEGWFCLSAVNKWWMGRQWAVGQRWCLWVCGNFQTPAAPEEWFWLPGVNRGGWVGNGRSVSPKVASSGSVTILRHRLRRRNG